MVILLTIAYSGFKVESCFIFLSHQLIPTLHTECVRRMLIKECPCVKNRSGKQTVTIKIF